MCTQTYNPFFSHLQNKMPAKYNIIKKISETEIKTKKHRNKYPCK